MSSRLVRQPSPALDDDWVEIVVPAARARDVSVDSIVQIVHSATVQHTPSPPPPTSAQTPVSQPISSLPVTNVSGSQLLFAPPPVPPRAPPAEPSGLLLIEFSDLERHELLGRGSFGAVWRATWKSRHQVVAVKVLRGVSGDDMGDFMNEVSTMAALTGTPHIAHFYGACKQPPSIIMEYLPKGSLHKLLRERGTTLDWSTKTRMAYQIVKGVNFLHNCTRPIFHRDIKSLNLLVDRQLNIKVIDFGMARVRLNSSQQGAVSEPRGTIRWNAPELYRGERYTEKSDVFSIGTVLWELVATDNVPYPSLGNNELEAKLAEGELPVLVIPPGTPAVFERWITWCRSIRPRTGPRASS